jgi:hypothetical protein
VLLSILCFVCCGFLVQVPPAELEALLITHPLIADAAVVPSVFLFTLSTSIA